MFVLTFVLAIYYVVPIFPARIDDKQIIEIKATVEEAKEVTQFCDEDLVSKVTVMTLNLNRP